MNDVKTNKSLMDEFLDFMTLMYQKYGEKVLSKNKEIKK